MTGPVFGSSYVGMPSPSAAEGVQAFGGGDSGVGMLSAAPVGAVVGGQGRHAGPGTTSSTGWQRGYAGQAQGPPRAEWV